MSPEARPSTESGSVRHFSFDFSAPELVETAQNKQHAYLSLLGRKSAVIGLRVQQSIDAVAAVGV